MIQYGINLNKHPGRHTYAFTSPKRHLRERVRRRRWLYGTGREPIQRRPWIFTFSSSKYIFVVSNNTEKKKKHVLMTRIQLFYPITQPIGTSRRKSLKNGMKRFQWKLSSEGYERESTDNWPNHWAIVAIQRISSSKWTSWVPFPVLPSFFRHNPLMKKRFSCYPLLECMTSLLHLQ